MKKILKNKKKSFNLTTLGFTLIELLAVIIILAIVALIATPIILNVIEDARISAGKSEANMILGGINNYCASEEMKYQLDNSYERICTSAMDKDDVKKMVNLGNATINELVYDGEKLITLVITSNNHKFTLCSSGTFVMDDEECEGGNVAITTGPLIDILLQQYQEGNDVGLVKDSTNENLYYYTGTNEEVSNNFLWYGGHQWRILEFDKEAKTLTLITQQPLTAIKPASAVWESKEAYESSYINTWLTDYFFNSLDSSIRNNILDSTFNIGIYTDVDEITTSQKVGLLDETQYDRAGGANSFLDIKNGWWLGNRNSALNVRTVSSNGSVSSSDVTLGYGVRPVIKINNIDIIEGKGTLTSNYKTDMKATTVNDIQIGEYINIPTSGTYCGEDKLCTFRLVNKDSDTLKLVLNGLLPTTSTYGDSNVITTTNDIYSNLNAFADSISTSYFKEKTFYIGDYIERTSYTDIQDETLTARIGLPTVGEMFSGNDINIGTTSTKTFVDVNTIENPITSSYYWTMNRTYESTGVNAVEMMGILFDFSQTGSAGVRPVIYFDANFVIENGDGTAQNPYLAKLS